MQFTWTRRSNGSWGVRIPDGTQLPDDGIVTVTSRDGREERVHLTTLITEFRDALVFDWEPADKYLQERALLEASARASRATSRLTSYGHAVQAGAIEDRLGHIELLLHRGNLAGLLRVAEAAEAAVEAHLRGECGVEGHPSPWEGRQA